MRCNNCGADLADNAKFCTSCGASLQATPPQSRPSFCTKCGKALPAGTSFCTSCGQKIGGSPKNPGGQAKNYLNIIKDKINSIDLGGLKNRRLSTVGVVIAVLVVLSLISLISSDNNNLSAKEAAKVIENYYERLFDYDLAGAKKYLTKDDVNDVAFNAGIFVLTKENTSPYTDKTLLQMVDFEIIPLEYSFDPGNKIGVGRFRLVAKPKKKYIDHPAIRYGLPNTFNGVNGEDIQEISVEIIKEEGKWLINDMYHHL